MLGFLSLGLLSLGGFVFGVFMYGASVCGAFVRGAFVRHSLMTRFSESRKVPLQQEPDEVWNSTFARAFLTGNVKLIETE